jgi:hypothetical protein
MRIRLRSRSPGPGALAVALLALLLAGCAPKPVNLHVQGTVQTVGSRVPIPGAEILIEWPAALGGGQSQVRTDEHGHFAVGRTLRKRHLVCSGLTLTVQAENFASAYDRYDDESCGKDAVLNFTLEMLPQPR